MPSTDPGGSVPATFTTSPSTTGSAHVAAASIGWARRRPSSTAIASGTARERAAGGRVVGDALGRARRTRRRLRSSRLRGNDVRLLVLGHRRRLCRRAGLRPGRDGQNRTTCRRHRCHRITPRRTPPCLRHRSLRAPKRPPPRSRPRPAPRSRRRPPGPPRPSGPRTGRPRHRATTRSHRRGVSSGDALTTSLGVRVDDTDNCLRVSSRGPTLLEDFHLREKIMHFDHERIPERVVHARGAGGPRHVPGSPTSLEDLTQRRRSLQTRRRPRRCSCASRPSPARAARPTPLATCAASRRSSTRSEGNFDLVGNNIPVFFIQDGIKFPDLIHAVKPEPDREIPQAQIGPRHVLGLRVAAARVDPHADVGHVGPGDPAVVPHDGGLRRPHVPARRTPTGTTIAGEVALEAGRRHPRPGVGGVAEARRHRPRLPPPRPLRTRSQPATLPQWELGVQVMPDTRRTRPSRASTCSTRPSSCPRSCARCGSSARMTLDRNPANYFAETEQVAFHPGHLVPGIELDRRSAAPRPAVLVPRHAAHPPRRPELRPDPDQPAGRAGQRQPPRRLHAAGGPRGSRAVHAELARRRLPVRRRRPTAATSTSPAAGRRAPRCKRGRELRRPLQPGDALLNSTDAGRAGPHRRRLQLRARQVRVGRRRRADGREPRQRRRRALCRGWPSSSASRRRRASRRRMPGARPRCR